MRNCMEKYKGRFVVGPGIYQIHIKYEFSRPCLRWYSWPTISMGSTFTDSTNWELKIFEENAMVLLMYVVRPLIYYVVKPIMVASVFNMYRPFSVSLFPKQYSIKPIYIAFTLR